MKKEITQLPLNAHFRRAFWHVLWLLASTFERFLKRVKDGIYDFTRDAERRIRLPPGTLVEQTEHPFPAPRGPWVIKAWHDEDYSLVRPGRSRFLRAGRQNSKYDTLYVYPRHVKRLKEEDPGGIIKASEAIRAVMTEEDMDVLEKARMK